MHGLEKIKESLEKELDLLSMDDKLSMASLEKIHKLTDTIKNIGKIEMYEEAEEGSSERSYRRGGSYDGGSYARRRRDSMGRYAREGGSSRDGGYSREEYSREGGRNYSRGYSRDEAKDEMIEKIEGMMREASSEKEKMALEKCLIALENA